MSAADRPRRIWITRTQPQAEATAAKVAAMGFTPIVAPLLEARPVSVAGGDLAGFDALAFTSRHAIEHYPAPHGALELPVFTVGAGTAEAARRAGFASVASADGDVRALAILIASANPRPAKVLNPTAREPAADLPALLAEHAIAAVPMVVYETVRTTARPSLEEVDAVMIHSAKAARALADSLAGGPSPERLGVYALSEAAAAPLRRLGLRFVSVAPRSSEAMLLALLKG